ncbi:hypothetical protein NPIL_173801 [Nephila pilipes]|uniref:Uncharacterized protein n=1 Tax=Nephila pilipes TaxID=299642 RepID=A0A8X6NC07_NEPPI|nr:hypothetical protein NPIL_173801 [Nephila pilipes]
MNFTLNGDWLQRLNFVNLRFTEYHYEKERKGSGPSKRWRVSKSGSQDMCVCVADDYVIADLDLKGPFSWFLFCEGRDSRLHLVREGLSGDFIVW